MSDGADTLSRLLEDPEIQAAANDSGDDSTALPTAGSLLGALPPDLMAKLPALMGALGPMLGTGGGQKNEKTALLLALKPYMSPQRCDAIDKLIMLSRLGDVMQRLH